MRQGYTAAERSHAAFVLRRDIRKAHVDVRFNSRVAADCWSLIDAIENNQLYIEPPPPLPSAAPPKRKTLDSQSTPSKPIAQRKSKRKKVQTARATFA